LKWLENKGVSVAPRFIGLSDDGREITSFLAGSSPNDLIKANDSQLHEAGQMIKTIHDALSDFPGCAGGQTVCHNDLSPCNFMFLNGLPYAVFDWDAAAIGDRLDDVAYAIWMWCRIGSPENSPIDAVRMINIILNSYGLRNENRKTIINKIHEQIKRVEKSMTEFLTASGQYERRENFQQWTNDCSSWLFENRNEIAAHFISA